MTFPTSTIEVPLRVLTHPRLSHYEKMLWIDLRTANEMGCSLYSVQDMARVLKRSKRSVQKACQVLKEQGFLHQARDKEFFAWSV